MRNALFQARQFAFWMGVVVLFRILLHIPDAEGMLPVYQLELFSSCMDIFMYGLIIIYAVYLIRQWEELSIKWQAMLGLMIGCSSLLIILHLLTWRFAGCDPDVYWPTSQWGFKAIYLFCYAQLSGIFYALFLCFKKRDKARWWALAICITGLPNILLLFFLGPVWPFIHESFGFMLFKDLSMDIAFTGFYWALSNISKKG